MIIVSESHLHLVLISKERFLSGSSRKHLSSKKQKFKMKESLREEKGQTMQEILFSGSSLNHVKTLRSLLSYINTIVAAPSSSNVKIVPEDSIKPQRYDENGSPITSGTIAELRMRDLRLLDNLYNPDEIHSIIVRKNCVVLSLDPFRAVITSDRIIVVTPSHPMAEHNMDKILKIFQENFYGTPYLLRVVTNDSHRTVVLMNCYTS
jgi:hypothetical protein